MEQFHDSPINMLVAAAPQAALETARAVLGSLLGLPAEELDLLLDTFDAWVRASGSATVAGAALPMEVPPRAPCGRSLMPCGSRWTEPSW